MKKRSVKERVHKVLSVVLVYAVLIQQVIPGLYAMNAIAPNYTSSTFTNASKKTDVNEKREAIKTNDLGYIPESFSSASAVSSGTQAEISGSTSNSGGEMVDMFTGDLNYTLPLMDVEGFPVVISYNPNVGMEQEASWVGLGWNLSLGGINREMRGIPDDFEGDQIEKTMKMLDNTKVGSTDGINLYAGLGNPTFGLDGGTEQQKASIKSFYDIVSVNMNAGISYSWGKYFDNYSGEGKTKELGVSGGLSIAGIGVNGSLGLSTDSQNGVGYSRGFSFRAMPSVMGASLGGYSTSKNVSTNSRSGVKSVSQSSGWSLTPSFLGQTVTLKSLSRSSMRTFGIKTFVPQFQTPGVGSSSRDVNSYNGTAQFGFWYAGGGYKGSDYSTLNSVVSNVHNYPSYGYQKHAKGQYVNNAILDFNRESSAMVSSESKYASFSTPTYDLYYCSAPGLMSSFRAYRYDVVEYHDPTIMSQTNTHSTNDQLAGNGGVNVAGGVTAGVVRSKMTSEGVSISQSGGSLNGQAQFVGENGENTFDKKEFYYASQGELKPVDNTLFNSYQGAKATSIGIGYTTVDPKIAITGFLLDKNQNSTVVPSQNTDLTRAKNPTHYREVKIGDMTEPEVYNEVLLTGNTPQTWPISTNILLTDAKKAHHTGAMEVVNVNGNRFVFGIPVYNYNRSEVSFSASGLLNNSYYNEFGMLAYGSGDNSVANTRGRHQMFNKTSVPAFASSFLLTQVLNSEYVDRTNDGPTVDDKGNYFKINYTNPYDQNDPYKWRLPMCSNETGVDFEYGAKLAYANKNSHSDQWDDMASYQYGEKDLWFAASIESKNLVAFFYLEDRQDQFSAVNEDGGLDVNKPGKVLRKIMLYSKNDLGDAVEGFSEDATPLQVIEFEYDYSLCKKYVGNKNTYDYLSSGLNEDYLESGKLTLKAIYSYTGRSNENKTMPIEFDYGNNVEFAFNSNDRWGSYKPNDLARPNHEFPYAEQDEVIAQSNIEAWKLTSVRTIGGAKVDLEYAPDDYANVQERRAMRMFEVKGMSSTSILNTIGSLPINSDADLVNNGIIEAYRNPSDKKDEYSVVYFKLDEPINLGISDASAEIQKRYFEDHDGLVPDELYFNMYAELDNLNDANGYEYVESSVLIGKSFQNVTIIGAAGNSQPYKYGYVILEPSYTSNVFEGKPDDFSSDFNDEIGQVVTIPNNTGLSVKVNPLMLANWQYARINVPCTVYGDINYSATIPTDHCDYNINNDVMGGRLYKKLNKNNYGLYFNGQKSSMRLFEPDNVKIGGGSRVVSYTMNDNWKDYSNEYNSEYVVNYDYDVENSDGSNGVASYEPQAGNNVNPHYNFEAYTDNQKFLPNETAYQKIPWGELVYPGARVGYSAVATSMFDGIYIGKTIAKFHTYKDPEHQIILDKTKLNKQIRSGKNALQSQGYVSELQGFSQGFYVATNDFHGKSKETIVLGQQGEEIRRTTYNYYDSDEKIKFVSKDGLIVESYPPRDIDMHVDSWKNTSFSLVFTNAETGAIGFTMVGSFPFPLINYGKDFDISKYSTEATSITFNKVVNHYALIKSVVTSYLGSSNVGQTDYYDLNSGSILASSYYDEFDDKIFNYSYPAHWKYDNFSNMSTNDGGIIRASDVLNGINNTLEISPSSLAQLNIGDHLIISDGTADTEAWVLQEINGVYSLIDIDGSATNGVQWSTAQILIERTGVKNQLLASMMMSASKQTASENQGYFEYPTENIINAAAKKYRENYNLVCIPLEHQGLPISTPYLDRQYVPGDIVNPFLMGLKGVYRKDAGYIIQTDRTSFVDGVRNDGVFMDYQPFYARVNDKWYSIDEVGHPNNIGTGGLNDWRKRGEITEYDEFGKPYEFLNQVKINSAAIYGMNKDLKLLVKATASNAKRNEIAFEGFEDYNYLTNETINYLEYGFSLDPESQNGGAIVSTKKHSGKYSLEITGSVDYTYNVSAGNIATTEHLNSGAYKVQDCDCIEPFAPVVGEKYLFSTWVNEETGVYPYMNTEVKIVFLGAGGTPISSNIYTPSGAVIEGWQKIEGDYTIPAGTEQVKYIFTSLNSNSVNLDDFRTHPYEASMVTNIYDQKTLLLIASHGESNYTTFYNYNENLALTKVRIETLDGIITVSESEAGNARKQ
jgi:hypothetical protein